MSNQKSSQKRHRIPPDFEGTQVNSCKNLRCENFGIPAISSRNDPNYKVSGSTKARLSGQTNRTSRRPSSRVIICKKCNQSVSLKNNQAIIETDRSLSWHPDNLYCPNEECTNHLNQINLSTHPKCYVKRGKTDTGNQRWACKECGKRFVITRNEQHPSRGPHSHLYIPTINHVLNSNKIKRIMEVLELHPQVIYDNIEKAYKACLRFTRKREEKLRHIGQKQKEIFLCTDRQTYMINWRRRYDRRNIAIRSTATADCNSGYVFPVHTTYDPFADRELIHRVSHENEDQVFTSPLRRYSQYWLDDDYNLQEYGKRHESTLLGNNDPSDRVKAKYIETSLREDVDVPEDQLSYANQLPWKGMQLREEYVMHAHFNITRKLLSGFDSIHYFSEQESGLRTAYYSTYPDLIKKGNSRLFYINIKKSPTIHEREESARIGKLALKEAMSHLGTDSVEEAKQYLVEQVLHNNLEEQGQWQDLWGEYPVPTMGEVEKAFSHHTWRDSDDLHEIARIGAKATLLPIDNFFQVVRRRLTMLERPITSPASADKKWYGPAPYNPYRIIQLLEILRTYYNYGWFGDKKRVTPAMKLGLAKGQVTLRDILSN